MPKTPKSRPIKSESREEQSEQDIESESEQETEHVQETPETHDHHPQNPLDGLNKMANQTTFGELSIAQGPPFSVVASQIRDENTKEKLRAILCDFGLDPQQFEKGLSMGKILIPQLSEYCAILLVHQLRNLNLDIEEFGLSAQVHPLKDEHNEASETSKGIPPARDSGESRAESRDFQQWQGDKIFISHSPHTSYTIKEYLGPVRAARKVFSDELAGLPRLEDLNPGPGGEYGGHLAHYEGLIKELQEQATRKGAHGLVDLNFQLNPLASDAHQEGGAEYLLLATGNLVRF